MERRVSDYIRDLPFLWVDVDDEPGLGSDRAYIEQNSIALLSNYEREPIDPREDWLGQYSRSLKIHQPAVLNSGVGMDDWSLSRLLSEWHE